MNKEKNLKKDKLKYEPPKAVFIELKIEERLTNYCGRTPEQVHPATCVSNPRYS